MGFAVSPEITQSRFKLLSVLGFILPTVELGKNFKINSLLEERRNKKSGNSKGERMTTIEKKKKRFSMVN